MSRTSRKKETPEKLPEKAETLPSKDENSQDRNIQTENLTENLQDGKTKKRAPLLFRLTRRTVLFLFLFLLTSILFFAEGNYQNFLDENLEIIVTAISVTSVFLSVFSAAGISEAVYFFLKKDTRGSAFFPVQIVLMSLSFLASIAVLILFSLIGIVSKGFPS